MSLTSDSLSAMTFNSKALESVVKEQLHIIDNLLRTMVKTVGVNCLKYKLPMSFPIPGVTEVSDQQRFVYSSIITSLKSRGFDVGIVLTEETNIMAIRFMVKFTDEQVNAMNSVLKSVIISAEAFDNFVEGEGFDPKIQARSTDGASEAVSNGN